MVPKEPTNLFEATSSNIALIIFAASVEVRLDKKMTGEVLRSTLKKPPSRLRYELIYVSSTIVQYILNIGS
jgi:ribosomal protein L31E